MSDLRALAAKATPGPWFADHGKIGHGDAGIGEMDSHDDGAWIAACDPQTILGWIDRAERAEADADALYDALDAMGHAPAGAVDHGDCSGCEAMAAVSHE